MLPGTEMLACPNLAVSAEVMQHIVQVESGANPYAIGVVDGQLVRQPQNMDEALATAKMLESRGYNFSLGIAQVNRANLGRYGLDSFRKAFNTCDNLGAAAQILASCYSGAHGSWGKAFSCYYSGNFTTGFRDGYVQKVYASINRAAGNKGTSAAPVTRTEQAIPLNASATMAAPTSSALGHAGLRPVVVYATDSSQYRVALRSMAIDNAAAATMPLIISAAGSSLHTQALALADTNGPHPSDGAVDQTQVPSAPDQADQSSSSPNAQVSRSVTASATKSTDDGVFEPQVRGPNDPLPRSAAVAQGSAKRHADGVDLRLELGDDAFVF